MSLLDYAQFLEREVRKLDAPPILMGHSMGGLLAQILGARGLGKALVDDVTVTVLEPGPAPTAAHPGGFWPFQR